MLELVKRYFQNIVGVLCCYDRVVLKATIPEIRYADGMEAKLWSLGVRVFDFTTWAKPLGDEIKAHAERLAEENHLKIQYLRTKKEAQDKIIKKVLEKRGMSPGLVHIFSVKESCWTYKPRYCEDEDKTKSKTKGKTKVKTRAKTMAKSKGERKGKDKERPRLIAEPGHCLHYYFYFIDELLGLCYLRVPTWAPFQLQFYFNGHNLLANQLSKAAIEFQQEGNVFVNIADFDRAQKKADQLPIRTLRKLLKKYTLQFCPVIRHFSSGYEWTIKQAEYATDIIFRQQSDLRPFYKRLVRVAIHTVKPGNISTFLGHALTAKYLDEVGSKLRTRIEGTRIKHHMGPVSIKMYDKLGLVLRVETTVNDVTFFSHYRKVEHRDGTWDMMHARMRRWIFSLPALLELTKAANRRYLDFISALDDPTRGYKHLEEIGRRVREGGRTFRGFNLFDGDDLDLFEAIARGEFMINGFRNRALRGLLADKNSGQVTRMLKRLRTHKLIKRVRNGYKYYLTSLGRNVVLAALRVRELELVPALA